MDFANTSDWIGLPGIVLIWLLQIPLWIFVEKDGERRKRDQEVNR